MSFFLLNEQTLPRLFHSCLSVISSSVEQQHRIFNNYRWGHQSVSFVFLWQPSECIDLFVIDYVFVSFSENKYDDDDVTSVLDLSNVPLPTGGGVWGGPRKFFSFWSQNDEWWSSSSSKILNLPLEFRRYLSEFQRCNYFQFLVHTNISLLSAAVALTCQHYFPSIRCLKP